MPGLILRQVHPSHLRPNGDVASSVLDPFRGGGTEGPTTREISAYDGNLISAEDAYLHFTQVLGLRSVGVIAVDVDLCTENGIEILYDGLGFPEHISLRFPDLSRKQIGTIARRLKDVSLSRGWAYRPEAQQRASTQADR